MGSFTDYLEKAIIEHFLQGKAIASPPAVYVGLFINDPGEGNGGTETNYIGYARQPATWSTPGADGQTSNTNALIFPPTQSPEDVTFTHAVIFDAPTGGNRLFHTKLSKARSISTGDNLNVGIGQLSIKID